MLHKIKPLKELVNQYGPIKDTFSKLSPSYKNNCLILPWYGEQDSKFLFALKMDALPGINVEKNKGEGIRKRYDKFVNISKLEKNYVIYSISHEIKIASIAAGIALNHQMSHIYEIGPGTGLASHFYSRVIKEAKVENSANIFKLTSIEKDKGFYKTAQQLLEFTNNDFLTEIEYILGNGIEYLNQHCKNNDIVFISLAAPEVCKGILDITANTSINLVMSYSGTTKRMVQKERSRRIQDFIKLNGYEVFPFSDQEYNKKIANKYEKRYGIVALPDISK